MKLEDLNGKTILVTGGLGNIASHIIELLCKNYKGCKIAVIDNHYNGNVRNLDQARKYAKINNNSLHFDGNSYGIEEGISITEYSLMETIFSEFKPNYVFHYASMLTQDSKKFPLRAVDVNIKGTTNIFELSKLYNLEKVVFASSASVFGDPDIIPVNENHNFDNCSMLYGTTKICNEFLAKTYADQENLKLVGLRFFNVYGERQSNKNMYVQVMKKWIDAFIDGEPITIYADGKQTMDLIHAEDIANFSIQAMEKDIYRGKDSFKGFINVGTGIETSVKDLYNILKDILPSYGINVEKSKVIYDPHDPAIVKRRCCDVGLLEKHLGTHNISLEDGIKRMIEATLKERE